MSRGGWDPAPFHHGIGLSHGAQIGHELEHVGVGDGDGVRIHHRQGEARAGEQVAGVAHVDERRHPRRHAAGRLHFRFHQRGAQFAQGLAAEQGGEEQAVGLERAANLHQRAG